MKTLSETTVLGVHVTRASEREILEFVFDALENSSEKIQIFTPNPEIVMYANSHEAYRATLNRAQIKLADGVGLQIASRLLGTEPLERISGVDFMESLCKECVRKGVNTGFLGGREGVALKTALCLQKKNPGLKVSFIGDEWEKGIWVPKEYQENLSAMEEERMKESSTLTPRVYLPPKKEIDILFVAFGFPKQEEWISAHSKSYPARVFMGVGGAFDYFSGAVSRAPQPLRKVGLEWLYRLIRQPWRAKRQLSLLSFTRLLLQKRFSPNS